MLPTTHLRTSLGGLGAALSARRHVCGLSCTAAGQPPHCRALFLSCRTMLRTIPACVPGIHFLSGEGCYDVTRGGCYDVTRGAAMYQLHSSARSLAGGQSQCACEASDPLDLLATGWIFALCVSIRMCVRFPHVQAA